MHEDRAGDEATLKHTCRDNNIFLHDHASIYVDSNGHRFDANCDLIPSTLLQVIATTKLCKNGDFL